MSTLLVYRIVSLSDFVKTGSTGCNRFLPLPPGEGIHNSPTVATIFSSTLM